MTSDAALLAIDWGTSSLRGALLDSEGHVLEERASAAGILTVAPGSFATFFIANYQDWLRCGADLCLISGMAGSRQGWREAPYAACPAGFAQVATSLRWIEDWSGPGRLAIVPGLQCENQGVPDVMRGEETQIFGAMHLGGVDSGLFVLPGTHSKWARVAAGRVTGFRTYMTGEFYALLRRHSILARGLDCGEDSHDEDAFMQGVSAAGQGSGLLSTAFSARTLGLFERLPAKAAPSYLSGLVIGEELRAQAPRSGEPVVLVGAPELTARYASALAQWDVPSKRIGMEATWAGLHRIAEEVNA